MLNSSLFIHSVFEFRAKKNDNSRSLFSYWQMNNFSPKQCWICGNPSNSREHKIKKSDLVRRFGNLPFHKMGGMLYFKDRMSRQVQGPGSKILCYEPVICSNCNDNKSQPWDRAYEQFEKWVFENSSSIFQRRFIQLENVFEPEGYPSACPFLYKYFVKSFGCLLASANYIVPADLIELLDQTYFLTKLRGRAKITVAYSSDVLCSEHV